MLKMVEEADQTFLKDGPATKIIYCPIIGVDLSILLNKMAQEEQLILNEGIWALNSKFFELNNKRGYFCPNLMVPVHRIIQGKRKNYYHHLHEGFRLTEELENRLAKEMIKATNADRVY